MNYSENKFTISEEEKSKVTIATTKVMTTFPDNIAEHIVEDMRLELIGLYILTICHDYLKSLPPGVAGELIFDGYKYVIVKIEEDVLISTI